MNEQDVHFINRVLKYSIAGSFAGMVVIGGVLWFDISSIGTMFKTAENALLANLFLSGAMLKGAVFGAAIGMAMPSLRREPALARPRLSYRRAAAADARS
ncbi:MAG: hypothetical protein MUD06_05120 [Rhodospirillales bacterium]|jgi:hypothetical protein|nr:hypothetical protein [Rhodospirillales bacterium]